MRPPWRRRPAPPLDPAVQALADAVRDRRPLLVYRCGCMPCPAHAAAQEHRMWARAMEEEMRDQ